jgi:predicted dehydrogenase
MGYDDLKVIEAARFVGAVLDADVPEGLATVHDALVAAEVVEATVEAAATDSWVPVGTRISTNVEVGS